MARRYGWSDDILQRLEQFESLDLDEGTKLALRLAERATLDSRHVEEALFTELRRHYDEGALIELMAVIGVFNYFNRFNNAFEVEPTQAGDR